VEALSSPGKGATAVALFPGVFPPPCAGGRTLPRRGRGSGFERAGSDLRAPQPDWASLLERGRRFSAGAAALDGANPQLTPVGECVGGLGDRQEAAAEAAGCRAGGAQVGAALAREAVAAKDAQLEDAETDDICCLKVRSGCSRPGPPGQDRASVSAEPAGTVVPRGKPTRMVGLAGCPAIVWRVQVGC
jgi:hypothetical protein